MTSTDIGAFAVLGVIAIVILAFIFSTALVEYEARLQESAVRCAATTNYTLERCLFELKR